MGARSFGARVQRVEDPRLITGSGRYTDDISVPGLLHAAFVRSPHAHARILGIDSTAAAAVPGVVAVLTLADLPGGGKPMPCTAPSPALRATKTYHPLASGAVHFVGEAVALVVAESRAQAEDAAALVTVDYAPLPAVADLRAAVATGAARAHDDLDSNVVATLKVRHGDVEDVFANAAHVFTEEFFTHRGGCHAMECRGVLANPDPMTGRLVVTLSTQIPYAVKRLLAGYLGRDEAGIQVIAPDVGGGFGPKASVYPEDYAIPLAAVKLGRPVKWIEDRREHFLSTHQQRDQIWTMEVACDASGRMLAMRGRCLHDSGAYTPNGVIVPLTTINSMPGPYALQAFDVTLDVVLTNLVPVTPVRGAGRPNTCFVLERLADRVARELGLDPADVRRRSFVTKQQMPYPTGLIGRDGRTALSYDDGDFALCLDSALARIQDFRERQAAALAQGRYLGIGLASYVEDTGQGPYEGASIRILQDGTVTITTGAAAQGQGLKTILAQIAADALGARFDSIRVEIADTDRFPLGLGTVASRVAVTAGSSVHEAAGELREQVLATAGDMLSVGNRFLEIEDGVVRIAGEPDKSVTLAQVAQRQAGHMGVPLPAGHMPDLAATAYFQHNRLTYANGANVCEVEVDLGTGAVEIQRYVVVHDCGRLINPALVDGQIRGGVVHGIGNALFERMRYDEAGNPVTTNYGEYALPLATEMPRIEVHHIETPSTTNPIGVKGVGEGGTIPAAACVIAAIEDALAPFAVRISEHPISPERILELIAQCTATVSPE